MSLDSARIKTIADAYTAAWNTGSPEGVASFYSNNGSIVINRGAPWLGRKGVAEMAAGFFAEVPDLRLTCDAIRCAGDHVVYLWTFTGTHATTRNELRVTGWEEWEMDADYKVHASAGWYDAKDYARQTASR